MKKWIILTGLVSCVFSTGFAQSSIEFIPMGGYTFSDKLQFSNTFGKIDAGFNYGGSFQFNIFLGIPLWVGLSATIFFETKKDFHFNP